MNTKDKFYLNKDKSSSNISNRESKKGPLVSIIVNCFNGEKYLNECFESILKQTYENYEVIFWDNCSSDNSKKIFLEIKDERFKYRTDNLHVSLYEARNKAFACTIGKYICFLDVDDQWLPNKLMEQISIMESNPNIGFCYSGFKFLSQADGKLKSSYKNKNLKGGRITKNLLRKYNVGILTLMINKHIVIKNNIKFDNRFTIMGDLDFVLRLSRVTIGIPIKSDLAIYRIHQNNLSQGISLTVKERELWQSEMISLSLFKEKDLKPFLEETKYLNFINTINSYQFKNSINLLLDLNGIFLLKGIYLFITKLKTSYLKTIKIKLKLILIKFKIKKSSQKASMYCKKNMK